MLHTTQIQWFKITFIRSGPRIPQCHFLLDFGIGYDFIKLIAWIKL